MTPGSAAFRLAYEISPIYLTGGVAGNVPGATVPLISFTEGGGFSNILGAGLGTNLDDFFCHFIPLSGARMISNEIGQYPFANQAVAANAIITTPLTISMVMICPCRHPGDYARKQAVITSLLQTIDAHNMAGGTYSVATPAFLYTDCVMLSFMDASSGETKQAQYRFQIDFRKPLISEQEARQRYNSLMAKIGSQTEIQGDATWSNVPNTVGNPASGAAPNVVPETNPNPGQGFAPTTTVNQPSGGSGGFVPDTVASGPQTAVASTAAEIPSATEAQITASTLNIPSVY